MPITMSYDNCDIQNCDKRIINSIVETKRVLNPWDMIKETHEPNGAWAKTYNNGLGDHNVISVELIKEEVFKSVSNM